MDTDPNAYSSSSSSTYPQQRPPAAGHRTNSSQDIQDIQDRDMDPRDPRAAAHSSPQMGALSSTACSSQRPSTPQPAPSSSSPVSQAAVPAPHAESSGQAAGRRAAAPALQGDMFTPLVSPTQPAANHSSRSSRASASGDHLQQMLRDEHQPEHTGLPPATPSRAELLVAQPLARIASQASPALAESPRRDIQAEWARVTDKPMERIASQAGPCYPYVPSVALKRARSLSDPPENQRASAVHVARTAAKYFRGLPRKKMRMWSSKDAAEHAEGERIMRQIRGRAQDHYAGAGREPPVSLRSLRVLDSSEVLRLPQMRHDLLFDNYGFRPINTSMTLASTQYGLHAAQRSQIVRPSPPCLITDRYWACIRAEVDYGCRCTRWESSSPSARIKECICGRWKDGASEATWWKESRATWPSRLPKLIQTLKQILESLMASTTPCATYYTSRDSAPGTTAVTHSLVPALFEALDPEFLTVQVRRRNFDIDMFRVIGEAMKVHCAPVRDEMVDDMVATALGSDGRAPDVVSALRRCFDCVEVMKLDIANHQVQALKGVLWQQAEQNEMTTFINYLVAAGRNLETSKTYAWINAASKRVAMATSPRERRHIMGQCVCANNTEFVIRSLADGVVDLVFGDWVEKHEPWPPVVPSRRPGNSFVGHVYPSKVVVPEVFKMDSIRLKNFHSEMVDIAVAQSILEMFKDQFVRYHPGASAKEVADQVAEARESYKHVMTLGSGLERIGHCPSDLSLHLAHRVIYAHGAHHDQPHSNEVVEQVTTLANTFDQYIAENVVRRGAPVYQATLSSLRKLVHAMLTNTLLMHRVQPESFLYDLRGVDSKPCTRGEPVPTAPRLRVPARRFVPLNEPLTGQGVSTTDPRERYHRPTDAAAVAARTLFTTTSTSSHACESALATELGFEALVHEIRAVVDRMVKTADFNLCVFANLYARQGMLIGSGKLVPLPELEPEL